MGGSGSLARYVMALTSNLAGVDDGSRECGNITGGSTRGRLSTRIAAGPLVDTDSALRQVFDWFNANGGDRAPAVSVRGRAGRQHDDARAADSSPYSIEYAGGVSRTLGPRTSLRVDGVFRDYRNLLQPAH